MSDSGAASQGLFITLEGGEGAGKSTLARRLAEKIQAKGRKAVLTREPGGTAGGEAVRHVLLSGAAKKLGSFGEALLFAAARNDHVEQVIRPALAKGDIVICDRFSDSSRAYQGIAGGLGDEYLNALERVSIGPTRPHLTLILDLDPTIAAFRRRARAGENDRFEGEGASFHAALRQAFRIIAAREPERCKLIDASKDRESVGEAAWALVEAALDKRSSEPAAI